MDRGGAATPPGKCNTNTIEEFAPPRQILRIYHGHHLLPIFVLCPALSLGQGRDCIPFLRPAFLRSANERETHRKKTFSSLRDPKGGERIAFSGHIGSNVKQRLSWQSLRQQENLGLVGAAELNESKPKADQGSLPATKMERAKSIVHLSSNGKAKHTPVWLLAEYSSHPNI
ncbi:hypothetical protein IEQ34_025092 [Dendrobium chrysotoxum]|uniref:Uncharacterized protein n=1 Tax=Dendrobium chrysotoxum TaxID=161865 RepID=A0AAV7FQJ0_DENCH|nr:hypothetical protein IEQ34_025092 [Dendrobium chrysotoxum]